jgi:hypothetical protein
VSLQVQYTPNREASLLSQLLKEKFSGVPDTPTLANAANAAQSDTPLAMLKTLACLAGMICLSTALSRELTVGSSR